MGHGERDTARGNFGWMELLMEVLKDHSRNNRVISEVPSPRVTLRPFVRQPLKDNFKAKLDSSEMSPEKDREISLPQF